MYFSYDGSQCAAGCLIPQNLYSPDMEGNGVHTIEFFYDLARESEDNVMFMKILKGFQEIHDYFFPYSWKREIRILIDRYGYSIPDCIQSDDVIPTP